MEEKLDLSDYSYVFSDDYLMLKRKNFIYGRNGTGKSTITKGIKKQFSDNYNVLVFNGYRDIFYESKALNTISLGIERVEQEQELEDINEDIKNIKLEIDPPKTVNGEENLFTRLKTTEKEFNENNQQLEKIIINLCLRNKKYKRT